MNEESQPEGEAQGPDGGAVTGRPDPRGESKVVRDSVDGYLHRILADLEGLQPLEFPLLEALGLVLAEDVVAEEPLPPYASVVRAGYALASSAVASASPDAPVELPIGEGGARPVEVGAPVPEGADAVAPVESLRLGEDRVGVVEPVGPGANVRLAGRDLERGDTAVPAGRRLRPGDIAVLAALARTRVRCHPRPRAIVLSAGDELVAPETHAEPGAVRDSNGPMLKALLRQAGAVTFSAGIVPDDRRQLIDTFDSNLGHADLFVTAGGGAGTVQQVLDMLGDVQPVLVRMEPGEVQLFGRIRGVPVFGLPGHPASSFVSFELFVRPALRRLQARTDLHRPKVTARLAEDVQSTPGRRSYPRVQLERSDEGWIARLSGGQDPHDLASLAAADGLAEVPEQRAEIRAGEEVVVHLLVEG
jgi:molybdopterin molybdotransferase